MRVVKNKIGKKAIEPEFGINEVKFFEIVNPQEVELGDEVFIEILNKKFLKNDKRGVPIYLYLIKTKKIYGSPISLSLEGGDFFIIVPCGDNKYFFKVTDISVTFNPREAGELDMVLLFKSTEPFEYLITVPFFYKDGKYNCDDGLVKLIHHIELPLFFIKKYFEKWQKDPRKPEFESKTLVWEEKEKSRKDKTALKNKKMELVKSSTNHTFPTWYDWFTKDCFVIKCEDGDELSALNGNENAVFEIGGFIFYPEIEFLDEDYLEIAYFVTPIGNFSKDTPEFGFLKYIMDWACHFDWVGAKSFWFPKQIFDLEKALKKHRAEFLFKEELYSSSSVQIDDPYWVTKSSFSENKTSEKEKIKIQENLEKLVSDFKSETEIFETDFFKIFCSTYLIFGNYVRDSCEEGIGRHDATTWFGHVEYLAAAKYFDYKIEYKINPAERVKQDLENLIENKKEKNNFLETDGVFVKFNIKK